MTTKDLIKVPTYLQKQGELGVNNIGIEDMQIPRLKIVQGPSQIKQALPQIKDGEIYNTLTNEIYKQPVIVFLLLFWKSHVWFSEDFKLLCTSYDDIVTGEKIVFGNHPELLNDPDSATLSFNYMLIPKNDLMKMPFPLIFSCMSTATKPARQLNGLLKRNAAQKIPIFGQSIEITTKLVQFTKGQSYHPVFKMSEYATEEEFAILSELYKISLKVHSQNLKRDLENEIADDKNVTEDETSDAKKTEKVIPF